LPPLSILAATLRQPGPNGKPLAAGARGPTIAPDPNHGTGQLPKHHLLGICGALRAKSTNRLLLREAARLFEPATFTEADLRLPLYDGDLEEAEGIPASVQLLADQIAAADAVVISTPEYNKALPGVLKNALDWVSRTKGGPWRDKPLAIVSAAAGRAGGERSQFSLRLALVAFRPRLLAGPELMIANSGAAFDADGRLTEPRSIKVLTELMQALRDEIGR
jgi:chromate reductase